MEPVAEHRGRAARLPTRHQWPGCLPHPTKTPTPPFGMAAAIAVVLLAPSSAEAYLDPGSGSLLFQAALAALASVAYLARRWLGRLGELLRLRRPRSGSSAQSASDSGDRDRPPT